MARLCVRLCSENGPVGRGLQDDAEIEEDLDPAVLKSLDEAVAALALVPGRAAAKEVLSLHDLSHFTLLPTSYPWGDVLFSTDAATKAGLHAVRNTLALRRLSSDAPALGSEEKLRFLRSWLLGLATALASVFEPLGREDTHPRVRQLMLDRLAQPQFWNAALTIATRQHAQLLHMHDTLEELETGTESLATGEQVAQWFGRSGPGDWPLHRLKVHIPAAAMAYLCDAEADASASGGGVALKGTIQSSRGMRFVMVGGLKAGYTPPIFQDVEPHRHLLLQQLRNRQALPFDCQDYCGLVGALEPSVIRTDMWIPFPAAGQSFADFARKAHVSSHRWRSAVLATPPVLDVDTAEMILPSVDAFQVQASGMTLQELRSKGAKTSKSVDDFLAAPSLSAFNALTNTVRSTLRLH